MAEATQTPNQRFLQKVLDVQTMMATVAAKVGAISDPEFATRMSAINQAILEFVSKTKDSSLTDETEKIVSTMLDNQVAPFRMLLDAINEKENDNDTDSDSDNDMGFLSNPISTVTAYRDGAVGTDSKDPEIMASSQAYHKLLSDRASLDKTKQTAKEFYEHSMKSKKSKDPEITNIIRDSKLHYDLCKKRCHDKRVEILKAENAHMALILKKQAEN